MKKLCWLEVIFIFFFSFNLIASDMLYQTLKGEVGARAVSMGGAFVAIALDNVSNFYNPAGYSQIENGYEFENLDYKSSLYKEFVIHSLVLSPFGFSSLFKKDNDDNYTRIINYSLASSGDNGVNWGVSYKNVDASINSIETHGWSSDFGFLINLTKNINLGLNLQDVLRLNVDVPISIRTGMAWISDEKKLKIASDLVYGREDNKAIYDAYIGAEYRIVDNLFIRGGWNSNYFSGGIGWDLGIVKVDVGLVSDKKNEDLLYLLGFKFGGEEQIKKTRYAMFRTPAFAEFSIYGDLIDGKSESSLLGGNKIGSNDLLQAIHIARMDPSCEGFILKINQINTGVLSIALVQEIRRELSLAKKDGKKIIVYLVDDVRLPEYYLASVADKIVMPRLGFLSHLGIDLKIRRSKDFFSKFGVDFKVITQGKYKDSLNEFADDISQDAKKQLEDLVQNLFQQVIFDIQKDRNLKWSDIEKVFDGRIVSAIQAKDLGMVDVLGYADKAKDIAQDLSKSENVDILDLQEFLGFKEPSYVFPLFNKIAVIEVDGGIHLGQNSDGNFLFGGKSAGADEISAIVNKIKDDVTIKGVILRINSHGGGFLASDMIYEAIERLKRAGKKVYTSMGDIATSGGYYISLNSDCIYANPATLTGSIGVISVFKFYNELNNILGINYEQVKTGKYMDLLSNNKKMTKEEFNMLSSQHKELYDFFVNKVKKHRKIDDDKLKIIAQGQAFTGDEALDLGLIDKLGTFWDVVDDLARETKIVGKPTLVYYRKSRFNLMNFLPIGFN